MTALTIASRVPADIVRRVSAEAVKAIATPEVRNELEKQSLIPVGNSPEEFSAFLQKDVARYAIIAKRIGLQPQCAHIKDEG